MNAQTFLFITDLDHTLVGDDHSMEKLLHNLELHRNRHGTKIVYSTGRSLHLYQELEQNQKRKQAELIKPDILICAVGTEVYSYGHQNQLIIDNNWSKYLSDSWDTEIVVKIAENFPKLIPQPDSEQRPFKISYFLEKNTTQIVSELEDSLLNSGLDIQVIYSYSDNKNYNNLDIVPRKANKGMAMTFVREKLEIDVARTIACGDSGNDIALFANREEKGIIVANAKQELLEWHKANPNKNRYLAKTGFAAGIEEGLGHFGFLEA
ncbi:sucrose-phosphate phosphatase [Okeanomitos corallinicola TIOX110]|uniref:sucrose-phosphate phosphatase n=1 Tax=Okeanomitos corallinicola TIOX110 TaxID=3133117 RepID=A0ABZ2UY64_9CYAN